MSKKNFKKVTEAGFIPGIYNYCDRWCEKCSQKTYCMSFAMGKKIEARGGFDFEEEMMREDENVWARLKDVFESTYDVLQELAVERGLDIEDIYHSENIDREFWGDNYEEVVEKDEKGVLFADSSDIIKICLIYEDLADKCLESVFEILDNRDKNNGFVVNPSEDKEVEEALDVINWYLDLIQAKMRRALSGYYIYADSSREMEKKNDYNGSAKVALLAIDRTLEAWKILHKYCSELDQDILHLLVILNQLKKEVERQFRNARAFQRPGFDEME